MKRIIILPILFFFNKQLLQGQTGVIGYSEGTSIICDCPVGYVAVGYRGSSGAWMDRLDIICRKLNTDRSLGTTVVYTNSVGAIAGEVNGTLNSGEILAPENMVLTGVVATSNQYTSFGNFLSSIQGLSAPIESVASNTTSGTTMLPQFGPTGINLGTYAVPPGNAVTGVEGFTVNSGNNYVGGLKLRYKTIAEITQTTSVMDGSWNNANTWSNQTIPTAHTDVLINTHVTVETDAVCNSLRVNPASILTIAAGKNLSVTNFNATKPIAGFEFSTSSLEFLPVALTTTNTTIGSNLTYQWSFGNNTSTLENPTNTYTSGGIFDITLEATNASGTNSITKQIRISPFHKPYTSFNSSSLNLSAWEGKKVIILSRNNNLDRAVMFKWLNAMDITYDYYKGCTGRDPSPVSSTYFYNKTSIADVPVTCGAGCGYLGATGIELQNSYFDVMYNAIHKNNQYDQAAFYEFGRNFWFYGDQLAYKANDPVTTGFAVFMRFMAMQAAGVDGAPFGSLSFADFQNSVINLADQYVSDPNLNWSNTLGAGKGVPGGFGGASDLFASFCFRLKRDFGGEVFVQNLWKKAALRPSAMSTQDAVDNFFLAACSAANSNLTTLFSTWRWPLSASAINAASQYP